MSVDYITTYNNKLKHQLCCYIDALDLIITELMDKKPGEKVGPGISNRVESFCKTITSDPQMSLFNPCFEPVYGCGETIEHYGVKIMDCKGALIPQYHKSVLALKFQEGLKCELEAKYLCDLVDSEVELFPKEHECDVTYTEAFCCLKQHLCYIKTNLCP